MDELALLKEQLLKLQRITFKCAVCGFQLSLSMYGEDNTCLLCRENERMHNATNNNLKQPIYEQQE